MRYLKQYNEKNIIFFDIETARCEKKLTPSSPMYDAWLYKARYGNEVNRKTGLEYSPEEFFAEKAALYAPFSIIACIVAGRITDDGLSTKKYVGDEATLLADFNVDLTKISNGMTVFCGFNNIGFDQPFIFKRMLVHGIIPHEMLDTAHLKPWDIKHIDLSALWKGTSFYPDSLVAVGSALGLPSPKTNMDGSEVSNAYYDGRIEEIAEYCERDVLTTANIFRKFLNRPLLNIKT